MYSVLFNNSPSYKKRPERSIAAFLYEPTDIFSSPTCVYAVSEASIFPKN